MCIICQEWAKQKITSKEAFGAIGEMLHTSKDPEQVKHLRELSDKILESEVPSGTVDNEIDGDWWNSTHEDE